MVDDAKRAAGYYLGIALIDAGRIWYGYGRFTTNEESGPDISITECEMGAGRLASRVNVCEVGRKETISHAQQRTIWHTSLSQ